jgi:protein SCO1/2
MQREISLWLGLVLCCLGVGGCRPDGGAGGADEAEAGLRTFEVRGVVIQVTPEERSVRIRHEEIRGYMAAMTMPFEVKDTNELAGLGPGDVVTFRMLVTADDGWIDRVKKVGFDASVASRERDAVRVVKLVKELEVGDEVPDYELINEFGRRVRLSEFRGRAVGLTFIFTRCPYPTFCPRQSKQFAEAAARLASDPGAGTNWHLVTVSFDPAHDTPEVLRAYARELGYDPARWSFVTGSQVDVDALTEQFGVLVGRDGELFSHNVRTAVVGPKGRVFRIFAGNTWSVDALVEALQEAARAE